MATRDERPDDTDLDAPEARAALLNALDACRERQRHFRGVAPNAAGYNRWKQHARAINWALRHLVPKVTKEKTSA